MSTLFNKELKEIMYDKKKNMSIVRKRKKENLIKF